MIYVCRNRLIKVDKAFSTQRYQGFRRNRLGDRRSIENGIRISRYARPLFAIVSLPNEFAASNNCNANASRLLFFNQLGDERIE